ncbi:hypothetical protein IWQ62_004196 [Dispira parvispora]|uniref:Glycosyl transferase family 25 domain-containing protein n=1 Tax=Dispira parvispora TaxID=1520584 RepID=A0A9W8E6D1_9FUNG|nr:hypothetical protein IWQ62_004196 [Dispira parvispora]
MSKEEYHLVEESQDVDLHQAQAGARRRTTRRYLFLALGVFSLVGLLIVGANVHLTKQQAREADNVAEIGLAASSSGTNVTTGVPTATPAASSLEITEEQDEVEMGHSSPLNRVGMHTRLGTDKVYLLNLPQRKDRLRSMELLLELLHVQFTVFPATDKEEVKSESLWINGKTGLRDAQLACWKSHMRIYEDVANDPSIDTALILEDDVDIHLDIANKVQLALDAAKSQAWDMLYVGHCSGFEGHKENVLNATAHLYKAEYPVCSHGYMVSKQGAKKLLQEMAVPRGPLDLHIVSLTKSHKINALALSPPLITQYHFQGDSSDINADGKNGMTGGSLYFSSQRRVKLYDIDIAKDD